MKTTKIAAGFYETATGWQIKRVDPQAVAAGYSDGWQTFQAGGREYGATFRTKREALAAISTTRDSTVADRPQPANQSPFRAHKLATRIKAARAMIAKRDAEIADIKKAMIVSSTPKVQAILAQRLRASTNNRTSWLDYVAENFPREARAVIHP